MESNNNIAVYKALSSNSGKKLLEILRAECTNNLSSFSSCNEVELIKQAGKAELFLGLLKMFNEGEKHDRRDGKL